jgi:FMN phosphatase YigB (HAD superfamily)
MVAGVVCREIDVVVLDKDGTLTDFHFAWGAQYAQCVAAVVVAAIFAPAVANFATSTLLGTLR